MNSVNKYKDVSYVIFNNIYMRINDYKNYIISNI